MSAPIDEDQPDVTDVNPPLVRLKAWLLNKLDSDSVRPWVPMYYWPWFVWAILATFWLPPVTLIQEGMDSKLAYTLWVWAAIPGTFGPIMGLWMRHGGSSLQALPKLLLLRDWMGLIFQAGGHAICCVLLIMFEISAWIGVANYSGPQPYAGLTVFAAVMLTPWMLGTATLCAQCVRKLQRALAAEKEAREAEERAQ